MDLHKLIYQPVASQPDWFRIPASVASFLWLVLAKIKNTLYDKGLLKQRELPGVCLSVGNIAVGGTGKSPVVTYIARLLVNRGYRVGILTRGYGSGLGKHDFLCLLNGDVLYHQGRLPETLPDEAMMQSLALPGVPVLASPDRYQSALLYQKQAKTMPQIWILDDGFQHRKLFRHIDLTLIDSTKPFGNGKVLPQGTLREPSAGLDRSSAILLTRSPSLSVSECNRKALDVVTKAPLIPVMFTQKWPVSIRDQSLYEKDASGDLWLVSGIAEPDRLLHALKGLGITVTGTYFVDDHESFSVEPHEAKLRSLSETKDIIITEKDFSRDRSLFLDLPGRVFILPLVINLPDEDLLRVLAPCFKL